MNDPWAKTRPALGVTCFTQSFTDRSKAVLLLWIICVIYVLCLSSFSVCSLLPRGHLLGKDSPHGFWLWLLLSIKYPGSGVVLDCIDSYLCPFSYFYIGKS